MPSLGTFGPQPMDGVRSFGRAAIQVIASAATIAPTGRFVRITGNVTINTITPPDPYFNGPLYIFNTDSSVGATGTSGNVQEAITFTRYRIFTLIYDPSTAKWYTNGVA